MSKTPLTDKQKRFCDEYLIDYNATKAAIRAGYSKKSAGELAWQLLQKTQVQIYLDGKKQKFAAKLEITQARTMQEIARLAFSDLRCLFREDGTLKNPTELTEQEAAILSSLEVDELFEGYGEQRTQIGFTKKIKLWDKVKALEMLAKHFNIYSDAPVNETKIIIRKKSAA